MLAARGTDAAIPRRLVRATFKKPDQILRIAHASERDVCLALGPERASAWLPWKEGEDLCVELYQVVDASGRKVARSLGRTKIRPPFNDGEKVPVFVVDRQDVPLTELTLVFGKVESKFDLRIDSLVKNLVAGKDRPPTKKDAEKEDLPVGRTPAYSVPGIRDLANQTSRTTTLDLKPMEKEIFFRLAYLSGSRLGLESHWENLLASALVLLDQEQLTPGAVTFALCLESAAIGYVKDGARDVWSFKNPLSFTPFQCFNGGDCEDGVASTVNRARELSLVAAPRKASLVQQAQTILRTHYACAVECVMMGRGVLGDAKEQPNADLVRGQGGAFHVVFALVPRSLEGPVCIGETCKMVVPRPDGFTVPKAAQPALLAMNQAGGWNGLEFVKPFALIYTEFVRLFVPELGCSLALTSSSSATGVSGKTLAEFLDLGRGVDGMVCDRRPMEPPGPSGFDFIPPGPLHCPERLQKPRDGSMVVLVEPGSDRATEVLPGLDFQGQIFLGCEVAHWSL